MPTTTQRAVAHNARKHTRGRADPFRGLTATHNIGVAAATVVTDTVFPDRTVPITFSTRIEITGAAADGIVFEFGGSTAGLKLAITGGTLYVAAGNATPASADGVDGNVALAALDTVGARLSIVVAIIPASGKVRVWVNGAVVLRIDEASETAMLNGAWAGTDTGSVGAAQSSTSTQRIGVTINGAPTDFALVEPLRVAVGQIPRQFDA